MSNAEIRGRFVWHELMTTDTDAASDSIRKSSRGKRKTRESLLFTMDVR